MSTQEGSGCLESDGDDSVEQQVASENDRDVGIGDDAQLYSASSELLKALYYWVLSRT